VIGVVVAVVVVVVGVGVVGSVFVVIVVVVVVVGFVVGCRCGCCCCCCCGCCYCCIDVILIVVDNIGSQFIITHTWLHNDVSTVCTNAETISTSLLRATNHNAVLNVWRLYAPSSVACSRIARAAALLYALGIHLRDRRGCH
jgi:hypothetical protein